MIGEVVFKLRIRYTAEEMKERVCKTFSLEHGCSGFSTCDSCWLSGGEMCSTGASNRIKRQAIFRAILDDKIVWHKGEMCVVEEDE